MKSAGSASTPARPQHLPDALDSDAAHTQGITASQVDHLLVDADLFDDLNPYAADGWWAAVDTVQGKCVVSIARDGDVDLAYHDASAQRAALIGTGRAVFAALPVQTLLED